MNLLEGLLFITGLVSPFGLIYGGIDEAGVNGGVGLPGIGLCWYECIDLLLPPPPFMLPGLEDDEDGLSMKFDELGGAPPEPGFPVCGN